MIRIIFISFILLTISISGFSQIEIKEDAPIDMMMRRYTDVNNTRAFINGWRIQIMAKTDRQAIEKAKEDFMLEFPGVNIDWTHSKPYYRLRTGAFQTKLEAIRMIQEIKKKYPGAFPVKDNISKQELVAKF